MSGELLVIVDDTSDAITYGGGQWTVSLSSSLNWYNGSTLFPEFAVGDNGDTGVYGSLNYTFHGTSIAFVGNTTPKNLQTVLVTIDGNSPYNTSYGGPNHPSYQQWYQSPHLDDGIHTIQLNNIAGTAVDFMVVSAGPSTPLSGQTVIVDDGDASIVYSGNWKKSGSSGFHNGTHQSTTPGDTASINFTGSSVALYGIFSWADFGSMSTTYTLDDVSSVKTYKVTPSTPEVVKHVAQQQNFLLFSSDSLAPGDHTLSINITEINNLTFTMDYLTYSSSFNSLATKPNITTPITPTPSTSSSTSLPTPSSSKNGLIRGAVGGVAGVVVALMLVLFILYKRRRRNRALRREAELESQRQQLVVKPYPLNVSADTNLGPAAIANVVVLPSSVPNSQDKSKHPVNPSLTTRNPPITHLPNDTLQRIRVVEALISELEPASGNISHDNQIRINQLRQRIDELAQENLHLGAGDSPPAYDVGV